MKECDITLINDNCIEVMQNMLNKNVKVDLTVTSPPYDNIRTYNGSSIWNFDIFKDIAKLLYDVTADGGVVVWIVGDSVINGSESGTSFKQALYFMELGFKLHDTMIYEKNSSSFPAKRGSKRYTQIFEYMFVFVKGKIHDCNLLCDKKNKWAGYTNWGNNTQYDKDGVLHQTNNIKPVPEYSMRNNIWKYSVGFNGKSKHPAVFPQQLATDHILSWSTTDHVVFDPFLGSGTTCISSLRLGRKFIGCEIDEVYFEDSINRIKNALSEHNSELTLKILQKNETSNQEEDN